MSRLEKAKIEEMAKNRPYALMVIQTEILFDVASILETTFNFLKETTPEGVDFPVPEKTVTEAETINFVKEYPYRRIRSIDFFNKGPDTVYVRVNEEKEIPIENREAITVSKPKATIEHVTLRVVVGESGTLKMVGHY